MKTTAYLVLFLFLSVTLSLAAGSSSSAPSVSKDIQYYNKGVKLMLDKKFPQAEKQFRKALNKNNNFAEAHNNLAYTLRKQGNDYFEEALEHYTKAVELKPNLPEPYMYRGVLYVQMGNNELALKDYEKLVSINSPLANELEYVIEKKKEKEPEQFFGVSQKK